MEITWRQFARIHKMKENVRKRMDAPMYTAQNMPTVTKVYICRSIEYLNDQCGPGSSWYVGEKKCT